MARTFWGFGAAKAPEFKKDAVIPPSQPATTVLSTASANANSPFPDAPAQPAPAAGDVEMDDAAGAQPPAAGQETTQSDISIPIEVQQTKGKLSVRIIEARDLATVNENSNPYVVCTYSNSEHISRSANPNLEVPSGIAIPNSGRHQSSNLMLSKANSGVNKGGANPTWTEEAKFDLTSFESDLEVTIYDANNYDKFLGMCRIKPDFSQSRASDQWYDLQPRMEGERVSGQVRVSVFFERVSGKHYGPSDFEILRLIGKGTFGQVYQVRKKDTRRVYAMKVLSKRTIVQKKEIDHTIGERDILVRTSSANSSFLVGLKFSFQTASDLYLVTDYMSGGELFWHLQREGRFPEQRAKFYIAELIIALEHLHDKDIVYRDLKPENILLDSAGHVALCDFGLSKANMYNGTTNTFCGTTEYLAPEVLLDDKGYTKMVDFWSLGVLIFEMCCGWSPFYAEDNQQMYKNIAFGKVRFPKDALSAEGRDFVKGLLNRNPRHRLGANNGARELMDHPFFADIDWRALGRKHIVPPFKPHVSGEEDTSNFDPEFTQASVSLMNRHGMSMTPLSPGIQARFKGFTFVDDTLDDHYRGKYGTSFRPRMGVGEGIDLYDDKDIKMSESYYTSGIKNKFQADELDKEDELMRMEEEDEEDLRRDEDDFVAGQGFEL